jgi:predicted Zn finger-like uncharacterized protein
VDITCVRCRRPYFVPDDLVQGRTFKVKCSQCGHAFSIDVDGGEDPGRRRPRKTAAADTMPSTSASAIPDLADALADADLGWLDEAAKEAEEADKEDAYVLLTVQRSKRGSAVALAAGGAVLAAVVAALGLWAASRYRVVDGELRPRAAAAQAAGPIHDVSGLIRTDRPDPAPAAPAPAPGPASAAPVSRAKRPRLTVPDRALLDLLGRKDDATPVGLPEEEDDQAASATSALDPEAAEKVIAQNRRAFDACISKALRLNPTAKLARRATMIVTVQPSGAVSQAGFAEDGIERTDLGSCLAETARRMVFPAFDGEPVDVAVPLSLSATF